MCYNLTSNNSLYGVHSKFTLKTFSEESYQVFQPDTPSVGDNAKHCNEGQSIGTREIILLLYCIAKEFHVLIEILGSDFESGGSKLETF